jgi:hypothetical protein
VSRILAKRAPKSGELSVKSTSRKINMASVRISGNRHFREQEMDWVSIAKYFVVSPQIMRITPGALKLVTKLKTVATVTLMGAWS